MSVTILTRPARSIDVPRSAFHTLDMDDVRNIAPSVFATHPAADVSKRYQFVSSADALDLLREHGYRITSATQTMARDVDGSTFARHMLRLRHESFYTGDAPREYAPEVIYGNAHNRTGAMFFNTGVFRFVCANGLIVASSSVASFKLRHVGANLDEFVRRNVDDIARAAPAALRQLEQWGEISMGAADRQEYARSVLETVRPIPGAEPISILRPMRHEDEEMTLAATFNTVQEHIMTGGVRGTSLRGRKTKTRSIRAISATLDVNRNLWELTEATAARLLAESRDRVLSAEQWRTIDTSTD